MGIKAGKTDSIEKKIINNDKLSNATMDDPSTKKNYNVNKKNRRLILILGCLIVLVLWIYWGNNSIEVTHHRIEDELIPKSFHGYTIVHISDLHNKEFGKKQEKLIQKNKRSNPKFDCHNRRSY